MSQEKKFKRLGFNKFKLSAISIDLPNMRNTNTQQMQSTESQSSHKK